MSDICVWVLFKIGQVLQVYVYDLGLFGVDDVEVVVEYCGVCYFDLLVINNEWGVLSYFFVLGYEVVGCVVVVGSNVKGLIVGQCVGVGWIVSSCLYCFFCLGGEQYLCVIL